jgi:hypothetical protein
MEKKTLFFIALAVCVTIILAYFISAPLSGTKSVRIVSSISVSQGVAENNTEMEIVVVHGTFANDGDIAAKNLTASVIFEDAEHNEVVRKTVKEGVNLLPNKELLVEFGSEYLRKKTIPKTKVNITIQFDWMENGQLKTTRVG